MRIIITAATIGEWMPVFVNMNTLYTGESQRLKVRFHQSGVGMLASAVSLTRLVSEEKPDLIIQAGIAGCFDPDISLGKVVVVKEEILGDVGVEEEGKWKDIFDLKLEKSNYHPFEKRKLPNPWLSTYNLLKLPELTGITVNQISTQPTRIEQLKKKYGAVVESMEGAALHFICREANIPFIQIRAISNYVGERNKAHWKMKEAIEALNEVLVKYVDRLYKIR
ncbi:MAG: futalosine hydrolase [Sediminibacterium sp. Gen4]|jgi:futalosine hydrolase|uniref:futalosine hydrolase n=1 Tax=unclassified Sediminibacterium TaxID=2635961 RepID=UPI0015BCFF11|nr:MULTISPECIES: futalosine hydrolase [unclassified Sediminibacterium]MBW0162589.1 futalosine hydrolase [Sediminibacterium sp.]MBW0165274.1 futalosine hydrolase [Sediminibacterium sp.]NWK65064.1 futalosine hydrolase [Sediminibacterium sp. Gen4]